jgi:alpha-tubulin suppressor-like RCC1 family protein
VKDDGTLWGVGANFDGNLGTGNNKNHPNFSQLNTDTDWRQVVTSDRATLALKKNGTIWSWGPYTFGLLGDPALLGPRLVGNARQWSNPQ